MKIYIRADIIDIDSEDVAIRKSLAEDPNTRMSTLVKLMSDPDPYVRSAVAVNPSTTLAMKKVLAKDPNILVLRSLIGDSTLPASVLRILARSWSADVRWLVLSHPNVTDAIIDSLEFDEDHMVREWAIAKQDQRSKQ